MQVRQEHGQQADRRQIGAQVVDVFDAAGIGQFAEQRGTEAAHAERETEEQAGDHADLARQQFLRVDQDRRERGRQDQSDDHAEHTGPEQVDVRQQQRERQHAEDRYPDHVLAAEAVADRSADQRAERDRAEKVEKYICAFCAVRPKRSIRKNV